MWNLFEQQPLLLEHPADRKFAVAAVSKISETEFVWWNADYLIEQNSTGLPGSGFADNPIEGKLHFDEDKNIWIVENKPDWIYKFFLPDRKMLEQWQQVKKFIPSAAELQTMASN